MITSLLLALQTEHTHYAQQRENHLNFSKTSFVGVSCGVVWNTQHDSNKPEGFIKIPSHPLPTLKQTHNLWNPTNT